MINVSPLCRELFLEENNNKKLIVDIGSGQTAFTLNKSQILLESLSLTETLHDADNLEVVGCVASQFKLQIANVPQKLVGKRIVVNIQIGNEDYIPLFNGEIESEGRTANRHVKEITAYDDLYDLSQLNLTNWFLDYEFPCKGKQFREDFFDRIGITCANIQLGFDKIDIPKFTDFVDFNIDEDLYAIDILKSICQAEGKFGIINRDGDFEFRSLARYEKSNGAVPGASLVPPFIPGSLGTMVVPDAVHFPSYRSVNYNDYDVTDITTVNVRQDEDATGTGSKTVSSGRTYTVMGNLFTRYMERPQLDVVAENIVGNVKDIMYTPFDSSNIGLPFLEVGDCVQFYCYDFEESDAQGKDVFVMKYFFILKRTLSGLISMKDTFSAKGERKKYQSDLGYRNKENKEVQKQVKDNTEKIKELEEGMWKFILVQEKPTTPHPRTVAFREKK